jgi:hypothetical protein
MTDHYASEMKSIIDNELKNCQHLEKGYLDSYHMRTVQWEQANKEIKAITQACNEKVGLYEEKIKELEEENVIERRYHLQAADERTMLENIVKLTNEMLIDMSKKMIFEKEIKILSKMKTQFDELMSQDFLDGFITQVDIDKYKKYQQKLEKGLKRKSSVFQKNISKKIKRSE